MRHRFQQQVTLVMAHGVVKGLEIVQIDEQQSHRRFAAGAGYHRLAQAVQQQASVGQPGERVVEGQMADFVFGRLALRDVDERRHIVRNHPARPLHCRNMRPLRIDLAILAPVPDFAFPGAGGVDTAPQLPIKRRIVTTRAEHARRLAHYFFKCIASNFAAGRVDAQNLLVGIGNHHALLHFERGRRNAQIGLGALALGNIFQAELQQGLARMFKRHKTHLAVPNLAIGAAMAPFKRMHPVAKGQLDVPQRRLQGVAAVVLRRC